MVRTRPARRHADVISIATLLPRGSDTPPRNGLYVTDAVYNTRSSIRRVPEHPMVPAEACDGQDPARSTSCGRDIDTTLLPPRGQTHLRVTVCTLLTRYTTPVRRSGGYLSTPWYHPRCVMVRTRPARRHADVISIQRSRPGVRHASA